MSSIQIGDAHTLARAILDLEIKMRYEIRWQTEKQLKGIEKHEKMMEKRMENIESKVEILLKEKNNNNSNEWRFKYSGGRNNFDEDCGAIWSPNNDFDGHSPKPYHHQQQRGFVPKNYRNNNNNGYYGKDRRQNWDGGLFERNWQKEGGNLAMENDLSHINDGLFYGGKEMPNPNSTNPPENENGHRNNSPMKLKKEEEKTLPKLVTEKWVTKIGEYYTTEEEEEDEENDDDEEEDSSDYRKGREQEMDGEYFVARPAPGYFDADGNRLNEKNNDEDSDECENSGEENSEEEVVQPMSIIRICPAQHVFSAPLLYRNSKIPTMPSAAHTLNSGDIPPTTKSDDEFGKGRRN